MTLGAGVPGRDYRQTQYALEDRALAEALSGSYGGSPSFEITTGFDPSDGANHSGGANYIEGMALDASGAGLAGVSGNPDILKDIENLERYMDSLSKPYPAPYKEPKYGPTVASQKSSINKGWNAAAQPGSPPGFAEMRMGAMSYEEAMNWTPAPLTTNLGALAVGPKNYQEPARDLRPGFGGVTPAMGLLAVVLGGAAWWLYANR